MRDFKVNMATVEATILEVRPGPKSTRVRVEIDKGALAWWTFWGQPMASIAARLREGQRILTTGRIEMDRYSGVVTYRPLTVALMPSVPVVTRSQEQVSNDDNNPINYED